MPPAPNSKQARSGIASWYKRRQSGISPSVSTTSSESTLTSQQQSASKTKPIIMQSAAGPSQQSSAAVAAPPPPRKESEPIYFEEDYREEILKYMTSMDNLTLASAELMDMQPELQWFMRPYLIDFLIEVHQQFRLRPEVLYLAMNIVDRYVSKRVVYKKHYQLVGCASLWIAAKFEDGKDKVPLVRELADMCCKAYDESAFIQMEGHVLSTIQWITGHPSAEAWLREYSQGGESSEDTKVQNVARFLMEITLFHREFVGINSSFIAAGALMLARYICGKPRRSVTKFENIPVRIAIAIDKHFAEKLENISEIVIRKYSPTYYARASTVVREWYLSGRRFVYQPESPVTPVSANLVTPGLQPSGSWPGNKRGSWISGSPSNGSISCSSSEAGDDGPITPITPHNPSHDQTHSYFQAQQTHQNNPSVAKENVNPHNQHQSHGMYAIGSSDSTSSIFSQQQHLLQQQQQQQAKLGMMQGGGGQNGQRGPLHPLQHHQQQQQESLPVPPRSMRRLSN